MLKELVVEESGLSIGSDREEALKGRGEERVEGRASEGVQTKRVESGDEGDLPQPQHQRKDQHSHDGAYQDDKEESSEERLR